MTRLRRKTLTSLLAAALLLGVGGLSACSSGSDAGDAQADGSSDPQSYYEQQQQDAPGVAADNTFVDEGVSGYVDTTTDNLSTFALDVDNGSYRLAEAFVAQGVRPPVDSVRPEEWVNAFPYDDPAPTEADLAVSVETAPSPSLDDDTQVVRVAVRARDVPAEGRPPVNLTLVVDRSGSMGMGERLGLVKSSLSLLAESLRPDDTVSVVGFDDQVELVLPPTPVAEQDSIMAAVEQLTPRGSTNLAGGLSLGYEQARSAYRPGGVNVVVLCSDGVANVGMTGPEGITATIAEEGRNGIHLVTVGYGMGNYNDHLMEQLADQGDGFYRYVDTYEEARHLFVDELTSLLTPVADDARAQVSFDPELVTSYRLVGYDNRAMDDRSFEDLTADAGELGAGHRATALYEVRLASGVQPGQRVGSATVRWASPTTGAPGTATADIVAADVDATPTDSMTLAMAVADLAQVVKGAGAAAERSVTAYDVEARVTPLATRGVPGAADLLELSRALGALG